jgi:AbrB family looped-hinge helix DNA binding protein
MKAEATEGSYGTFMAKIVTVNGRGGFILPKEFRDKLGVTIGGQLVLEVDGNGKVVLRAPEELPGEIYSDSRIAEFKRMNELPLSNKKLRWRKA